MTFQELIAELVNRHGQGTLADMIGVDGSTMSRLRSGQGTINIASLEKLFEIAQVEILGQSVTNAANKATFNVTDTKSFFGAALVGGGLSPAVKGDTEGGGILLCAAKFASLKPCENGDTFKITATVSAQNVT